MYEKEVLTYLEKYGYHFNEEKQQWFLQEYVKVPKDLEIPSNYSSENKITRKELLDFLSSLDDDDIIAYERRDLNTFFLCAIRKVYIAEDENAQLNRLTIMDTFRTEGKNKAIRARQQFEKCLAEYIKAYPDIAKRWIEENNV